MDRHEPIFNVPTSVLAVLAVLIGIHVVRTVVPTDFDTWLVLALAFIPARYSGYAQELPGGWLAALTSPLTHTAIHGDVTHLAINCAWLLAFGGVVAQRVGGLRFFLISGVSAIAGAATYLAIHPGTVTVVVGASGAIAGLMGASMRFFFSALDSGGLWQLRRAPASVPMMPLGQALRDRRVMLVTLVFVLVNVLAVIGLAGIGTQGGIAWEAHIGGYLAGFLTFGFFDRPRYARLPDQPSLH